MQNLSIQKRIIVTLISFIVFTALVIGTLSLWTMRSNIETRVFETELPATVQNVASIVSSDIEVMTTVAKLIANDDHIINWYENGADKEQEAMVVSKLGKLPN